MTKTETITLRAKPGKEEALKAELVKFIHPCRRQDGCLDYHIVQSSDEPGLFVGFMIFRDEEAYNRHESSEIVQSFIKNKLPGLVEGQPEFKDWRDLE